MKMLSRIALAMALAGGAAVAVPVVAKDKEAAKAPGLKLSPGVIKVAKPAQDAIGANNPAAAEPLVAQVEAAAQNQDDKYIASAFRLSIEAQKIQAAQTANPNAVVDQTPLVKPLDALIANPSTPPADLGKYYFRRAAIAFDGKQYPVASDYFVKAQQAGYTDPQIPLLIVRAKVESGDVAGGLTDLDKVVADKTAKGEKTPDDMYRYAIAHSNQSHLAPLTLAWLNKYAAAYPNQKTWYEVLATYGLQQDAVAKLDNQQKIDLFRLMRASGGLADQYFYIEYAEKVQTAGLPTEAQAVLKEGLANGKIPAGNTAVKEMLTDTASKMRQEGPLTTLETRAKSAANGALASQTADAYLGEANYAKAVDLYKVALTKGGVDADTVNTRLGIALARSGDKVGATAAFAAVKGSPRTDIAKFWTTWLNQAPAA